MTTGLMLVAMLAACSQSRAPAQSEAVQPAEASTASLPAADLAEPESVAPDASATPAPAAPQGSMVVYACEDGSGVTVTYDKYTALVKLPSGSTMLSRAEGASSGDTDAYLGEELSLYRSGDLVQLQAGGKTRACSSRSG